MSDTPSAARDALDATTASLDAQATSPGWKRLVEPVARLAQPDDDERLGTQRLQMAQAGFRQPGAAAAFYAAKVGLVLGLPLLGWLLLQAVAWRVSTATQAALLLGLALAGYALPGLWLAQRIRARQRRLFEALPDALDLMIVCVEAGQGLDMALDRAGREIRGRSPDLADEFDLLGHELRLGATRARALRQMAQRTGLEEVRQFAAMLVQADRFGIGVAGSLRVHAQSLRHLRQARAEEAAARLPLKLLFPLVFFLFPSMLLVLMGPAALQVMRQMGSMSGG